MYITYYIIIVACERETLAPINRRGMKIEINTTFRLLTKPEEPDKQ